MPKENPIHSRSLVVRSSEPVENRVDGDIVLMSVKRGKYFGLDAVSSRIWELLSKPVIVADLFSELEQEYEVEPKQCEHETLEFLNKLYEEKLILIVDE